VTKNRIFFVLILIVILLSSCSIKKMAIKTIASSLSSPGSGDVFSSDNDPELVGDALPFTIKLYETLSASLPQHRGLLLMTGSLYVMYANAFLDIPASMLTEEEYKKQEFLYKRAKNLYLRGRDIILNALEKKYPNFLKYLDKREYKKALNPTMKDDLPFLYWAGAGWLGAFAIDPFDMKLGLTLPKAKALLDRVFELDQNYLGGSIYNLYVLYYGSVPEYMGGDFKKARNYYKMASDLLKDKDTTFYISLATTVSVKEQNVKEFRAILEKVLAFNPDSYKPNRLVNTINLRRARWLLEHVDDFFLLVEDTGDTNLGEKKDEQEKINEIH
jgi:predicted anti-sigma-YlaC factor YlaD